MIRDEYKKEMSYKWVKCTIPFIDFIRSVCMYGLNPYGFFYNILGLKISINGTEQ